ncbi:MAG: SIMPL domain-containing protein, partial [Bacteroidales bacterium]|nr:SIMPL domain-containing protein [Bacteroidales bacterium]
ISDWASYEFTGLNELKPEMIAEATANARQAAQKFAEDSKSKLGKIKTANQGQFSVEDLDETTEFVKKVRVVTTIVYYLD